MLSEADLKLILRTIKREWPHSVLGASEQAVLEHWGTVLGDLPLEDVQRAVLELIATRREHAPRPGLIAAVAAERAIDAPEWDEAWAEVLKLASRFGADRPPAPEKFSHPVVARFALQAWREVCHGPARGTQGYGTHHAQQREAYKALAARVGRDAGLAALGAPRRRSSLERFDPAALLGQGKKAIERGGDGEG